MTDDADRDDAERLRGRQAEADQAATRTPPPTARGAPCVLGKVVTGGGTAGLKSYEVRVHDVTGEETEGTTGVLTDSGYSLFATQIGATAPAAAAVVLCVLVDHRWVFRT